MVFGSHPKTWSTMYSIPPCPVWWPRWLQTDLDFCNPRGADDFLLARQTKPANTGHLAREMAEHRDENSR